MTYGCSSVGDFLANVRLVCVFRIPVGTFARSNSVSYSLPLIDVSLFELGNNGGAVADLLVVSATGQEGDRVFCDAIDESVFLVNSAAPRAR